MTALTSDRYSRMILWLKVLFPLMALGLLSTLFLLSRTIDPEAQIPFADKEIQDRLRDQQVTGPFFSGTTADGDQISFAAETLTTPSGKTGANEALDVRAEISLVGGTEITLTAKHASFDLAADSAEISEGVEISTSTGYRLRSDLFIARMSSLDLISPGEVRGNSPAGDLTAGAMAVTKPSDGGGSRLIFTKGVKLIYDPKTLKE